MNEINEEKPEIIFAYTRKEALEDGELIDLSGLAKEAGFKYPVAVSRSVYEILEPTEELRASGQSFTGRAWDMLSVLRWSLRRSSAQDRASFAPLFLMNPRKSPEPVNLWAVCGPGDEAEPVITIMIQGED